MSDPHTNTEFDAETINRWLDGELPPAQAQGLEQAVTRDEALAQRVALQRRFLGALAQAGDTYRAALPAALPAHVQARVRLALASPRRRAIWPAVAAAATVLLAVGAVVFFQRPTPVIAQAVPMAVLRAVDFAAPDERADAKRPGTCDATSEFSPMQSDVVRMGNYRVMACDDTPSSAGARLVRVEDLPVVGWAAEKGNEATSGPDIGMTVLRNYVVFDVRRGRTREYLAVARSFYDPLHKETDRASCIVCHNRSRKGQANPHNIKRRMWSR